MKSFLIISAFSFLSFSVFAQTIKEQKKEKKDSTQIVEAACGQCQLDLKGDGCSLAVRINGKAYFVDGTEMSKHGNAHASDGMCNTIRKAEVIGEVKNDRFKASSFKLLPSAPEKK